MKYRMLKELSTLSLAVNSEDGQKVIIDRVEFPVVPRENLRLELQRELQKIVEQENGIQHNKVINYLGLDKYENQIYLIRESGIETGLKPYRPQSPEQICQVLLQILEYLKLYHENQLAIGGLSLGMLKQDTQDRFYLQDPMIINYLSNFLTDEYRITSPPEVLQGRQWSFESDIFSWGLLAYRLLTGEDPYHANTPEERIDKILKIGVVKLKDIRPEYHEELSQLIMDCINKTPEKRPQAEVVLTALNRLVEEGKLTVDQAEIEAYLEKAAVNRLRFERKEKVWLWFRKYGTITGIITAGVVIGYLMFFSSRGKPTITETTQPIEVVNYYYQAIKNIDAVLVSEAVHKADHSFEDVIANLHVINATRQGMTYSAKDSVKIEIENLKINQLQREKARIEYRTSYTLRIFMKPDSIENRERTEILTVTPVRKVWRITKIQVLHEREWSEPRKEPAVNN